MIGRRGMARRRRAPAHLAAYARSPHGPTPPRARTPRRRCPLAARPDAAARPHATAPTPARCTARRRCAPTRLAADALPPRRLPVPRELHQLFDGTNAPAQPAPAPVLLPAVVSRTPPSSLHPAIHREEDITNRQNLDPKEVKRQRDREYYARNKESISKRRRQARELKKQAVNDENTLCYTPSAGQSGVTQVQYKTPTGDMAPTVQHTYASQIPLPNSAQFIVDDSLYNIPDVETNVGCTAVSLGQPGATT